MNIYQKMSAITQEISTVAKNLMVGEGRNQYKAVGEADVLAAVKPVEAKHGVYSYPVKREIIDSGEMVSTSTYNGQTKETRKLYLRVATTYRFVNMDEPTEYIDIVTYGDGVDTQDKAPGKAMTYSDKYALLKAYKIQTGDDPDQHASEPLASITSQKISLTKATALEKAIADKGVDVKTVLYQYGVTSLTELTEEQHASIVRRLEKTK